MLQCDAASNVTEVTLEDTSSSVTSPFKELQTPTILFPKTFEIPLEKNIYLVHILHVNVKLCKTFNGFLSNIINMSTWRITFRSTILAHGLFHYLLKLVY